MRSSFFCVGISVAALACSGTESRGTATSALSDCEPSASVTLENDYSIAQPIPVAYGRLEVDSARLDIGTAMGEPMRAWIEATLDKKYVRKNGTVEAGDYDHRGIRAFHGARITHVDFPGTGEATVSITIETTNPNDTTQPVGHADGGMAVACPSGSLFSTSHFRLTIGGTELTPAGVTALSVEVPGDGSNPVAADLTASFDQLPASLPGGVQAASIDYFTEDGAVALTVQADVELAGTTQNGFVFHVRNVRLPSINPGPPGRLPSINPGPPG